MEHYCGIDFGTSNSVIALYSGADPTPNMVRQPSLIYFPDDPESSARRFCGEQALSEYVADGMTGRFFQSIKTVLPDPLFTHTMINGKRFSAEDLVAVMLRFLRLDMEQRAGIQISRAVVGRPARFSADPDLESLAHERLLSASRQAGFEEVEFEFEPVAGAHSYMQRVTGEAVVFVADHGGGTSDFTVMRMKPGPDLTETAPVGLAEAGEVLATHGIRAGGDDFDAQIMWNRVVQTFGFGATYESFGKDLPVPVHIFRIISRWDQIHFLKTTRYREELRYYLRTTNNPLAIRRLIKLVEENLGWFISQAVERAKIDLSASETGTISYEKDKLRISQEVTRAQFNGYVSPWLESIGEAVDETLRLAGVTGNQIGVVFVTGGSSSVPAVREVLRSRFPPGALVADTNQFQSVAEGLALSARQRRLATT